MYIISSCLLGENCKYNGGNNACKEVIEFSRRHNFISVCPECEGGLPTPRVPSEIIIQATGERKVLNQEGKDVTKEFILGSEKSYNKSVRFSENIGEPIEGAILKARSPSCGYGDVYDGTFSGRLTRGNGVFSEILIKKGIKIITEKEFIEFIKEQNK